MEYSREELNRAAEGLGFIIEKLEEQHPEVHQNDAFFLRVTKQEYKDGYELVLEAVILTDDGENESEEVVAMGEGNILAWAIEALLTPEEEQQAVHDRWNAELYGI